MSVIDWTNIRIGVLCGGNSPERPGSIASGEAAFKSLSQQGLNATLVDLDGADWGAIANSIDVALLASHGLGGEDGKVQGLLELYGIPYSGSGVLASSVGMHKPTFKGLLRDNNVDTPRWLTVTPAMSVESTLTAVTYTLGLPVFVKPASGGGSLGAGIAHEEKDLRALLQQQRDDEDYVAAMVEEYIEPARPATVGIIDVDGKAKVLPVHDVETDRPFYDYEAKHDLSLRRENCPSVLPPQQCDQMQKTALWVHRLVGAHGVSRVDFMAAPSGRSAVLEINTVPGLSPHGNLATMARAGGIEYDELMRLLVATAFTKPSYVP